MIKDSHKVPKELVDLMIEIKFPFSGNPYDVTIPELLDIIPSSIKYDGINYSYQHTFCLDFHTVQYNAGLYGSPCITFYGHRLQGALAESILWLHENNYISFSS